MSSSDLVKKEEKKAKKNKVMGWVNGLSSLVGVDKFVDIYLELERRADEEDFLRVLKFFINEDNEVDEKFYNVSGLEYANIILNSCIDDMDSDKENYYKNLLLNIVGKNYTEQEKKSFAYLLKNLTEPAIKLAQLYYIASNYEIKGFKNINDQVNCIVSYFDEKFLKLHQRELQRYGLLKELRLRDNASHYEIEGLLNEFIELVSDRDDISLKSVNRVEKQKYDILFLKRRIFNNASDYIFENNDFNEDENIKSMYDEILKIGHEKHTVGVCFEDEWGRAQVTGKVFVKLYFDDELKVVISTNPGALIEGKVSPLFGVVIDKSNEENVFKHVINLSSDCLSVHNNNCYK